jgi:hypothetical protein
MASSGKNRGTDYTNLRRLTEHDRKKEIKRGNEFAVVAQGLTAGSGASFKRRLSGPAYMKLESIFQKYERATSAKACNPLFLLMNSVGWLMGLEPTTTGITILDSTN